MQKIPFPTEKHPSIENVLSMMMGKNRRDTILSRECMTCGADAIEFRDELSMREYSISGMCQKCQDKIFGE